MTDEQVIVALTDRYAVALTIFGEARSEAIEGRIAVANCIRNRLKANRVSFGRTPLDVCMKPWQFSCWKKAGGGANHEATMNAARQLVQPTSGIISPMLRECLWITDGLLGWQFGDNTHSSTHYLTAALFESDPPKWVHGLLPACRVGAHLFFIAR